MEAHVGKRRRTAASQDVTDSLASVGCSSDYDSELDSDLSLNTSELESDSKSVKGPLADKAPQEWSEELQDTAESRPAYPPEIRGEPNSQGRPITLMDR